VDLMSVHLTGLHLMGLYLTGLHFMSVFLIGVYLMAWTSQACISWVCTS
jgi:hypothetical protein